MTLLGGDLTYFTSINRTSMDYCDRLFDLRNPNTLWTMGNHDLNNRNLIQEYTGRPSYYAYYHKGICFVVLDVELDASGLSKSLISGAQLNWFKNVADTISKSEQMLVLHGRLLWMPGNPDFESRMDSVAESTRQLITVNFYPDVFPILQKVKSKGIPVICLGGDKSKINIDYSPEDSIHFLASTMAPEFTDDENDVMVFTYKQATNVMSWKFVSLSSIDKKKPDGFFPDQEITESVLQVWQGSVKNEIKLQVRSDKNKVLKVQIFSMDGRLCRSVLLEPNKYKFVSLNSSGLFVVKTTVDGIVISQKIALP
jgi:hypothetical protein